MRHCLIVAIIILLSACYTKQGAIKRFCHPETSTVQVVLTDTVYTDSIRVDTAFLYRPADTVQVVKDKLLIRYIKVRDSIYLHGKYMGDTLPVVDTVQVEVTGNCPDKCPKTVLQRVADTANYILFALLLGLICGFLMKAFFSERKPASSEK